MDKHSHWVTILNDIFNHIFGFVNNIWPSIFLCKHWTIMWTILFLFVGKLLISRLYVFIYLWYTFFNSTKILRILLKCLFKPIDFLFRGTVKKCIKNVQKWKHLNRCQIIHLNIIVSVLLNLFYFHVSRIEIQFTFSICVFNV